MCACVSCVCNAIAFLTLAQSLTTTKTTQIATKNGKSPVEKSEKKNNNQNRQSKNKKPIAETGQTHTHIEREGERGKSVVGSEECGRHIIITNKCK